MTEFCDPYLVQRLERSRTGGGGVFGGVDNPFSFGGGLRNGGLSGDAMDLLRPLFSFAYMGAAEFEFGAVSEALSALAKNYSELVGFEVSVPLGKVIPGWRDKRPALDGYGIVYVIAPKDIATDVSGSIIRMATNKKYQSKERVGLDQALRPYDERDSETVGWLALGDNPFMFFTDADVRGGVCALFGVEVAANG